MAGESTSPALTAVKKVGKQTRKWIAFRKKFLKTRMNWYNEWECVCCFRSTAYPEVDHIQKRGSHQELKYDESNLRILCGDCHSRRHN